MHTSFVVHAGDLSKSRSPSIDSNRPSADGQPTKDVPSSIDPAKSTMWLGTEDGWYRTSHAIVVVLRLLATSSDQLLN